LKEQSESRIGQSASVGKGRRGRRRDAAVDLRRPSSCRACGAASCPPDGCVQLRSHGPRSRIQKGATHAGGAPRTVQITVWRFLCVVCQATFTVAPAGVLRRRLYRATAIGLALFSFGVEKASHAEVRAAVAGVEVARESPTGRRWSALVAWSRAAKAGALVFGVGPVVGTLRAAAARVAIAIEAYGRRLDDLHGRVFDGALTAPWRGAS
jgi:hypothetical protein